MHIVLIIIGLKLSQATKSKLDRLGDNLLVLS